MYSNKVIKFVLSLNVSQYIASRLSKGNQKGYSAFIIYVASVAVAISVAVMILSVSISDGYDKNIRKKIFGFWGHVQLTHTSKNLSLEEVPLNKESIFKKSLDTTSYVKTVNYFALKSALIKTDDAMYGIILKGVEDKFNWSAFYDFLEDGHFPKKKNEVLISTSLAKKMNVKVGDKLRVHFIQKPIRARAFIISGLYATNLAELDSQMIFGSIKTIQKLNQWTENQVGGVEVFVNEPEKSSIFAKDIQRNYVRGYDIWVKSIDQSNPEIFDWLNFLKTNQWIILTLMAVVAIVNMVSMLLVIILERSKMIGILKSVGASYSLIRNIFLRKAFRISLIGLCIGNLIGVGIAVLQDQFHLIKLDPEMYFLTHVPIYFNWFSILLVNLSTILVVLFSLLIPTLIIKRINPIEVLRFD